MMWISNDVAVLQSEWWRILKLRTNLNHKLLPLTKKTFEQYSVNLQKAINIREKGT